MSTFKEVIESTIKKKRILKRITFSLEAKEKVKESRRLKSPPPPPVDKMSSEEEEEAENNKEKENVSLVKKEGSTIMQKPQLKHSASFYFSKDCTVSNSIPICPQTPTKVKPCVVGK